MPRDIRTAAAEIWRIALRIGPLNRAARGRHVVRIDACVELRRLEIPRPDVPRLIDAFDERVRTPGSDIIDVLENRTPLSQRAVVARDNRALAVQTPLGQLGPEGWQLRQVGALRPFTTLGTKRARRPADARCPEPNHVPVVLHGIRELLVDILPSSKPRKRQELRETAHVYLYAVCIDECSPYRAHAARLAGHRMFGHWRQNHVDVHFQLDALMVDLVTRHLDVQARTPAGGHIRREDRFELRTVLHEHAVTRLETGVVVRHDIQRHIRRLGW